MKILRIIIILIINYCAITNTNAQPDRSSIINYDSPKTYEVAGIDIKGVKNLDASVIIPLSGLYVGKKIEIPGDDISNVIKRLWKQGLFGNVEVNISQVIGNKVFLEIQVKELQRLSGYYFIGLKKSEIEDIKDQIGLIRGRVFTPSMQSDVVATVEKFLIEKGFIDAKATVRQVADSNMNNGVLIEIKADRGVKTKIEEIVFEGNYDITDRKLKRLMRETKEATRISLFPSKLQKEANKNRTKYTFKERIQNLSIASVMDMFDKRVRLRIFNSSKFLKKEYEIDKNTMIASFYDKGFRDASIEADTLYDVETGKIKIKINIDQGKKYYYRNIQFRGNTKYSADTLKRILGIRKGDVYNASLMDSRLHIDPNGSDITSLYMDDGYLFFNLSNDENVINGDSIDVTINIYEGTQATIDRVIISGNDKTKEQVIRREIRTKPGNKFSRSDIIRSNRELAALGFFDPEKIEILPRPKPETGKVDIEYKVQEKSSDQFQLSAGYGGKDPNTKRERFNVTAGVTFNNFSLADMFKKKGWDPIPAGDGEALNLNISTFGINYISGGFSYMKPWFGGRRPNTLSVSSNVGYFSNKLSEADKNKQYSMLTTNVSLGVGWRLKFPDDFFNFFASINLSNYQLDKYPQLLGNSNVSSGSFTNPNFMFRLTRNSLDGGGVYTKSGIDFNLSWNPSIPISLAPWNSDVDYQALEPEKRFKWLEYHKTRFNVTWFTKLKGNLVLRSSVKSGFIGYFNKNYGNTPFDLFEMGDVTNFQGFRGFQGRDFIQLRGFASSLTDAKGTGFEIFNKFTMELRYPFSLNPQSTIYGLTFIEAGNGWHNMKDYNPFQLKRSVGVGLRFFLPMFGLIGLDYGIRFDPIQHYEQPIDRGQKFVNYLSSYGHINFMLGFEPE